MTSQSVLAPHPLTAEGEWRCYLRKPGMEHVEREDFLSFRAELLHSSGVRWKIYRHFLRGSTFGVTPVSNCCGEKFTLMPTVYCSGCSKLTQKNLVRQIFTSHVDLDSHSSLSGDDLLHLQYWSLLLHGDELSATLAAIDLKALTERTALMLAKA